MIYMLYTNACEKGTMIIQENRKNILYEDKPLQLIDLLCIRHGSTYEGRRNACVNILKIKQKVPILISEISKDLFFPCQSPTSRYCCWLNYRGIIAYHGHEQGALIVFRNGYEVIVDCSYHVIHQQMKRCKQLMDYLPFENNRRTVLNK